MKTSISDITSYRDLCYKAAIDDAVFNTFKQQPIYVDVLEHVTFEYGKQYINYLKENNFIFDSKFKTNDLYGSPTMYDFEIFGKCSPTTIRYVKVMHELFLLFGNLSEKKIVEIGGGYGGQCKIIKDRFECDYKIIDLDVVNLLIEKYLKLFDYSINLYTCDNLQEQECDLFVSNYAFSECCKQIQDLYLEKVINNSKHGYITCNFISNLFEVTSYSQVELQNKLSLFHNITVTEEKPLTYPNNILITW